VADHPLRPATDRSLGKPLPYQLANLAQAPPKPPKALIRRPYAVLDPFPVLIPQFGVDTNVLLTRPPLVYSHSLLNLIPPIMEGVKQIVRTLPLDLHVLGTPPAFILSQDQTLHKRKLDTSQWKYISKYSNFKN
jgi:hypothetical protein